MSKIFKHLLEIYEHFGSENISICGGLCDYFWINYTDIADIDIIVNTNSITSFFQIPSLSGIDKIDNYGFNIKYRQYSWPVGLVLPSNKFIENFYQGTYHDTKIDLFLVDNTKSLDRDLITVDGSKFGLKSVTLDAPAQRMSILNTQLNYIITDKMEKWEKNWIKFKKIKAKQKLSVYNSVFANE